MPQECKAQVGLLDQQVFQAVQVQQDPVVRSVLLELLEVPDYRALREQLEPLEQVVLQEQPEV